MKPVKEKHKPLTMCNFLGAKRHEIHFATTQVSPVLSQDSSGFRWYQVPELLQVCRILPSIRGQVESWQSNHYQEKCVSFWDTFLRLPLMEKGGYRGNSINSHGLPLEKPFSTKLRCPKVDHVDQVKRNGCIGIEMGLQKQSLCRTPISKFKLFHPKQEYGFH